MSFDKALGELNVMLDQIDGTTRSGGRRTIKNHYATTTHGATRAGETPTMYVVNFTNDEGFALLSTDDRMIPIFALADSGNLEQGQAIDNPGLEIFMAKLDNYITNFTDTVAMTRVVPGGDIIIKEGPWEELGDYTTSRINLQWGQHTPYNTYSPEISKKKTPAECLATAVAQVMAFHKWPKSYGGYNFDWDKIRQYIGPGSGWTFLASGDSKTPDMIGRLFQQISLPNNLNMQFGINGSGALDEDISRTFQNMGYSDTGIMCDYDHNLVSEIIIDWKTPIIVTGSRYVEIVGGTTQLQQPSINPKPETRGHAFIVDGLLRRMVLWSSEIEGFPILPRRIPQELVHVNWGWDGSDDGYYFNGAFDSDKGAITTKGTKVGNLNIDLKMIYWIAK